MVLFSLKDTKYQYDSLKTFWHWVRSPEFELRAVQCLEVFPPLCKVKSLCVVQTMFYEALSSVLFIYIWPVSAVQFKAEIITKPFILVLMHVMTKTYHQEISIGLIYWFLRYWWGIWFWMEIDAICWQCITNHIPYKISCTTLCQIKFSPLI